MGKPMVRPHTSEVTGMGSGVHRRSFQRAALVTYPDPALDRPSYEVDPYDPETIELAAALVGAMKTTAGCCGISAPQLGRHERLLVVDVTGHPAARSSAGLVVLANPEVLSLSGEVVMREECISFPRGFVEIARASQVVVAGTVPGSGKEVVVIADALEARCLLHELDHLDGITMIDRVA